MLSLAQIATLEIWSKELASDLDGYPPYSFIIGAEQNFILYLLFSRQHTSISKVILSK